MESTVIKRSIVVSGHKTSVSLEDPFWDALKQIGASRDMTLTQLVALIDAGREHANLSSAIRLFILDFYQEQLVSHAGMDNGSLEPASPPHDQSNASSGGESGSLGRSYA